LETFIHDVRHGFRSLIKNPGLTGAAIMSLALGIGANTTLFTWVKAVLVRPVPGASDPASLHVAVITSRDGTRDFWSYPNYRDVRARATTFDITIQGELVISLAADGRSERAFGAIVSGNYFEVMGVGAAAGRLLTTDDDRTPGAHPVVVLSYPYWQRRFTGDPAIVGRVVLINNTPFTVVGVTQRGFIGSFMGLEVGAWVPMAMQRQTQGSSLLEARGDGRMTCWARLRAGATREEASAELDTIMQQLALEYPQPNQGRRAAIVLPRDAPFGAPVALRLMLLVLSAVMMLVLAIACANVANLLLSRAVGRRREIAIRLSLGASRGRLLRQLLTESVLLALAAGTLAGVAAFWTSGLLKAIIPPIDAPIDLGIAVDGPTMIFALALSIATGVVFGLAPAWQATRADTMTALKEEGGRGAGGGSGRRLRGALVVAQVAVCLVLLVGAGLFMRSLAAIQRVNPGFDVERQLSVAMDLSLNGYDAETARQFHDRVVSSVTALPGVAAAAFSQQLPLGFSGSTSTRVVIDAYTPPANEEPAVGYNVVSARYFETMGIPIVAGREFSPADSVTATPAVVINETMATRYWSGRDPIGTRVRADDGSYVVVGIVRDIKYGTLDEPSQPHLYFNLAQRYSSGVLLQVRTAGDPLALVRPVREAVRAIDPNLPLWDARPVSEHMEQAVFPQRLGATLLGVMSALALLLATVGLCGVMSYAVSQRMPEMGVRLALGASPSALRRMVIGHGVRLTIVGVGIGLAAAFGATRLIASVLPGITATDPLTFVSVPAALLGVAVAAAWLPARRASRVDPILALRRE
jgi:predicted permease